MNSINDIRDWYAREMRDMNDYLKGKRSINILLESLSLRKGEGYWTCRRP